jgi:hypothetical protein
LYQATGTAADGTITDWNRSGVTFGSGAPATNIHNDIWDANVDVVGKRLWVACDGGIYFLDAAPGFTFTGPWSLHVNGLHTHQTHTLTVLPTTPVERSRLAYPTSDDESWCRDSSPIVMPAAQWQAVLAGGDVNFTIGDAGLPGFVLLARHRAAGTFRRFSGANTGVVLTNYKKKRVDAATVVTLPTVGPDGPTLFQFIQAPPRLGSPTLNAVMMTDLPLTYWDGNENVPLKPNSVLAQDSGGKPVLLRNNDFGASPDINTSKGTGWFVEFASLPEGTLGFYVSGQPTAPVYYVFRNDGTGLVLSKWTGTAWTMLPVTDLRSTPGFGTAFVNPYDSSTLFVLTASGIQVSRNGGASFSLDTQLTDLVTSGGTLPTSALSHMAFCYLKPSDVVAVTTFGGLFFDRGAGNWRDLSYLLPRPRSPLSACGVDAEAIYAATDGRGVLRIIGYRTS